MTTTDHKDPTMTLTHPDRSFPRLHPRPARGWLNDPNGIHFSDGRWHVFFQYNPASARHDQICWGHVSSADLVAWREEPVALRPQPGGPDSGGCWTGVGVVVDGVPTLVYSGVERPGSVSQVVVARGSADSAAFEQVGHVAAPMPDDPQVVLMRDPFLFEFEGRRYAIQGAGLADGRPAMLLFGADDLDDWDYHAVLLDGGHAVAADLPPANAWECPQLVRIGEDWVAIFSIWHDDVLKGVAHVVGSLVADPATGLPRFLPRAVGVNDHGGCYYAPEAVQVSDPAAGGERVLVWGWARELAADGVRGRTQADNDAVGWSGLLTHPRELTLDGDRLVVVPAAELTALRGEVLASVATLPDQAEVELAGEGTATLTLGDQVVWSGPADGVRILVDASLVEVFRAGDVATTLRAYPAEGESYGLAVDAGVAVAAWELRIPARQSA